MISRQMLLSVVLVLFALLGFVNARALPDDSSVAMRATSTRTVRMSNAERFRRGLPPNAPRQMFTPTRVLAPRTSNTVTTAYYAEVAYTSDPNTVAGYLAIAPAAGGYVAMVDISSADPYYAPANVPADSAALYTYCTYLARYYYVRSSSGDSSTTVTDFTGIASSTAAGINSWDFTDFDSDDEIGLTYVGAGSAAANLYVDPNNARKLYTGPSAAAINSAYSLSIAETDQVTITLVMQQV